MAKILYTNNASAKLASAITSGDTTLDVQAGQGAEFPTITGSDYVLVTLVSSTAIEIVKVTAISTDTFTIVRAQEGTTAVAFAAGDTVELRITAAALTGWEAFRDSLDTDGTLSANSASKIPAQSAVKTYVDAKVAGLSWKQAVRAATTAPLTLSSGFENGDTIDGVTLATGNRILIKDQSSGAENGIYTVNASGAPTRATDADAGAELVNASCYVSEGTVNADTQWTCSTNATITLGSTSLTFVQLTSGSGGALDDLSDVDASSPTDGDVLTFNNGSGNWEAAAPTGGGSTPAWVTDSPQTMPGSPNVANDDFGGSGYPGETALDTGGTRFTSATAWAWRNQGSSTATIQTGGGLLLVPEVNSQFHGVEQAISGTFKFRAHCVCRADATYGGTIEWMIYVAESGNKALVGGVAYVGSAIGLATSRWTTLAAFSADIRVTDGAKDPRPIHVWLEVEYDGTTIFFRYSPTGDEGSFSFIGSDPKASFLVNAPTFVGVAAYTSAIGTGLFVKQWRRIS